MRAPTPPAVPSPADAVAAVERAFVADGTGRPLHADADADADTAHAPALRALADAAAVAVAARFLAVGTPRSLGLVAGGEPFDPARAAAALSALETVFPRRMDLRCAAPTADGAAALAEALGGRATTAAQACACDLVVAWGGAPLPRAWLRRGTFVALVSGASVEAAALSGDAKFVADAPPAAPVEAWWGTLGEVAAGIKDGRELDELTVYAAGGPLPTRALARADAG